MTNAVYITERLPLKTKDTPQTSFEKGLLDYFKYYSPSRTRELVSRLEQHDFTSVKAHFIASVPGKWEGRQAEDWGLGRLAKFLKGAPSQYPSELFGQVPS